MSRIFNQLTVDGYLSREILQRRYRMKVYDDGKRCVVQHGEKGLVGKLDWLTFIVNDCSIECIFEVFGMSHLVDFDDDILSTPFKRNSNYDDRIVWQFNGLNFDFSVYDNDVLDDSFDFFKTPLSSVRCDFSGSGLDYLREEGFDVDTLFRNYDLFATSFGMGNFHCTRCDFAFDFVNFNAHFLDKCFDYVHNHQTHSGRLALVGVTAALRFSERHGDQETLYIGSPTSDRMLRIYDKRLQFIDRETDSYIVENGYSNPDSWIRLELQLRNKQADSILFGEGDIFSILRWIYDKYPFADLTSPPNARVKHKFWQELFYADEDFLTIKKLLLNQSIHFVQFVPREEKVAKRSVMELPFLIELLQLLKFKGISYDEYVNSLWKQLQAPSSDELLDIKKRKRCRKISSRISMHTYYDDFKSIIYFVNDGYVQFR